MNLSELAKLYDFTGRTVAITGATGVLCSSMAETLTACGANVALVVRNRDKGEQLAARLPGPGHAFVAVSDALDRNSLDQAAKAIISRFGQIDGLINGAGGNHPQATARPDQSFFDLTPEGLRSVLVFGREPEWGVVGISAALISIIFVIGVVLFKRTDKYFADVI